MNNELNNNTPSYDPNLNETSVELESDTIQNEESTREHEEAKETEERVRVDKKEKDLSLPTTIEDYMTLSFFEENDSWAKDMLAFCGSVSGRDADKAKKTGLKPVMLEDGVIAFEQAKVVLSCRKLYRSEFDMDLFVDPQIIIDSYPKKDFHYVYICEIVSVYTK